MRKSQEIIDAWTQLQEKRAREMAELEERRKRGQFSPVDAPRERVGMRRYAVAEVATLFGCSEQEIYTRLRAREFDAIRIDDNWEIRLPDVVPAHLRGEYERVWDAILALLGRYDPAGIASAGAPVAQYCTELKTILPRLQTASNQDDVQRIVHEEYVRWFSKEGVGEIVEYQDLAREIWSVWSGSLLASWPQQERSSGGQPEPG